MFKKISNQISLLFYFSIALMAIIITVVLHLLNVDDPAAWFQAIGSIVAIFVAFFIANNQHKNAKAIEEENRMRAELQRIEIVLGIFSLLEGILKLSESYFFPQYEPSRIERVDLNHFQDRKNSLTALPLFEIPNPQIAIYVTMLPRAIDLLCESIENANRTPRNSENYSANLRAVTKQFIDLKDLHKNSVIVCVQERNSRKALIDKTP